MAKILFVWPNNPQGDVYRISYPGKFVPSDDVVHLPLPGGPKILLELKRGYFPRAVEAPKGHKTVGTIWGAELVFKDCNSERQFKENWRELIALINAAAAVNKLFTVKLTQEEYARLANRGGMEMLEKKLSKRAQSLVRLEEDTWNGGGPAVELLRTGCCPG